MTLPINTANLISGKVIESERIEYKSGWNPGAVYRTICAFANDFNNIGGGYIILGVKAENGIPVRPVAGIDPHEIDNIQREMIGLNNLIKPVYTPRVSIEELDDKKVIFIWVPGGIHRPYEVPEEIKAKEKKYFYYIRKYGSTVKANKQEREELISLANKVPFDDRANTTAGFDDISYTLIKEHLRLTGSKLLRWVDETPKQDILQQMDLVSGPPEFCHPKNVALMLFSDKPDTFFPYTRVEVVIFPRGESDPEFVEIPAFTGPVQQMISKTLSYFKTNILKERVRKIPGQAEARRIWNYPYEALEEVVVNAFYHRDYQIREPVEIRIYPHSVVVLNFGGPDRAIRMEDFSKGIIKPRRYRNRRLGDFLKELDLTEGKATGIPLIRKSLLENGSPEAVFTSDEDRSYFMVELMIHQEFKPDDLMTAISGQEKSVKPRGRSNIQILDLISHNPDITIPEIASLLGISTRAVEKQISNLKAMNRLVRLGSKKSGHWQVLPDNV